MTNNTPTCRCWQTKKGEEMQVGDSVRVNWTRGKTVLATVAVSRKFLCPDCQRMAPAWEINGQLYSIGTARRVVKRA